MFSILNAFVILDQYICSLQPVYTWNKDMEICFLGSQISMPVLVCYELDVLDVIK